MKLQIVLVLCVLVHVRPWKIKALKRIKRNSVLKKSQNNRMKQEFFELYGGNEDPQNNVTSTTTTRSPDYYKKHNVSKPLAVILRGRERKLNGHQKEVYNVVDGETTANLDAKPINLEMKDNVEHLTLNADKRYELSGKENQHKKNHLSHRTQSAEVIKVVIPSEPIQIYKGFSPFPSLDHIMRFGNMMMFKIGLDALPYDTPKMFLSQSSPDFSKQENFYQQTNGPSYDFISNSLESSQGDRFNRRNLLELNNNPEATYSAKEPTQLANLMQTALDTLLANSDDNDKSYEFEMSCPLHDGKNRAEKGNEDGNEDGNVVQICSCRYIKNSKEDIKTPK